MPLASRCLGCPYTYTIVALNSCARPAELLNGSQWHHVFLWCLRFGWRVDTASFSRSPAPAWENRRVRPGLRVPQVIGASKFSDS